jgi:hypothetical protein
MAEPRDDVPREAARGRTDATPWYVLGGVTLTLAAVAGVVIAALLALWLVV